MNKLKLWKNVLSYLQIYEEISEEDIIQNGSIIKFVLINDLFDIITFSKKSKVEKFINEYVEKGNYIDSIWYKDKKINLITKIELDIN